MMTISAYHIEKRDEQQCNGILQKEQDNRERFERFCDLLARKRIQRDYNR